MGKTDRKKKEARAAAANCAVCVKHASINPVYYITKLPGGVRKRVKVILPRHDCGRHRMTGPLAF